MEMEIKNLLDEYAAAINTKEFIKDDPVQFPHRFSSIREIEITAFTTATISWGKREMILRDADRMLASMGNAPYDFVMNRGYELYEKRNVHRTFFQPDLAYMLRGFNAIYSRYDSIDTLLSQHNVNGCEAPAWEVCRILREEACKANSGCHNAQCFPSGYATSALKRINMAIRWLVRNDGIVDLGVWRSISPDKLFIPLDVHVGNTARRLGLLKRKSNDRKAVEELTSVLRGFNPQDPVLYDFALFGIGINKLDTDI